MGISVRFLDAFYNPVNLGEIQPFPHSCAFLGTLPRMGLPVRLPCPSRFVPTVASP